MARPLDASRVLPAIFGGGGEGSPALCRQQPRRVQPVVRRHSQRQPRGHPPDPHAQPFPWPPPRRVKAAARADQLPGEERGLGESRPEAGVRRSKVLLLPRGALPASLVGCSVRPRGDGGGGGEEHSDEVGASPFGGGERAGRQGEDLGLRP